MGEKDEINEENPFLYWMKLSDLIDQGVIINSNLTEEEINEIKINNNEYINSIKLFHEKILPEYYKAINI